MASEVEERSFDNGFGTTAVDEAEARAAAPKAVNPLLGASLLDEYRFAHRSLDWQAADLASSAAASIEAAGCPTELKRSLLAELDTWLARHGDSARPGRRL